jgi:hypothetical protein
MANVVGKGFGIGLNIGRIAFRELTEGQKTWVGKQMDLPHVLAVDSKQSATEVADQAEERKSHLIIVLEGDSILGIVTPKFTAERLAKLTGDAPGAFGTAVRSAAAMNDKNLNVVGLSYVMPDFFWCALGKHYTDSIPCPNHPK